MVQMILARRPVGAGGEVFDAGCGSLDFTFSSTGSQGIKDDVGKLVLFLKKSES
jgi:hypothetical protein